MAGRRLTVRERMREQERARRWFRDLSCAEKWTLGDDLVLGVFDWGEWGFESRPSGAFLNQVDYERMLWESEENRC